MQAHDQYAKNTLARFKSSFKENKYCNLCAFRACEYVASSQDKYGAHIRNVHAQAAAREVELRMSSNP